MLFSLELRNKVFLTLFSSLPRSPSHFPVKIKYTAPSKFLYILPWGEISWSRDSHDIKMIILKIFDKSCWNFVRCIFRTLWDIYGKAFCENSLRLSAVNYFHKFHLRCLTEFCLLQCLYCTWLFLVIYF